MNRNVLSLASALGLVLAAWIAAAQEPKTTTERIKESADGAFKSLKKGVSKAEEGLSDQYHKAVTGAQNMNVHARVYSRLHWDKALIGAKITTEVHEDGVTTLRGTVPDAKAKAKAILLATDTIGVTKVVDETTIQTVETLTPTGTTTTTKTTKETKVKTTTPVQP